VNPDQRLSLADGGTRSCAVERLGPNPQKLQRQDAKKTRRKKEREEERGGKREEEGKETETENNNNLKILQPYKLKNLWAGHLLLDNRTS